MLRGSRAGRLTAALAPLPLILSVAAKTMGEPVRPEDLWWHLGMGRLIASKRAIPTVDLFSFTRSGAPYFDQPWLGQILLFAGHRAGGLAALLAFDFVWMLLAEAFIIRSSLRRGARLVPALLVQFALAPVAVRGWSLRPQALAVPVFAAFVCILTGWRQGSPGPKDGGAALRPAGGPPRVWPLVPLMVVWANLHGSFPLGIALVLLTLLARAIDARKDLASVTWSPLAFTALGCALAPIVNPRGLALGTYVASLLRNPAVRTLAREWQPVTLADGEGRYILAILVLTALIALWKRPPAGDLVLILPFVLLDLAAVRNGIWLSLVLGPLVSSWIGRPRAAPAIERPPASSLVVRAAAVAVLLAVPWLKPHFLGRPYGPLPWEPRTPIAAVEVLARDDHRPARLVHGMAVGSFLIWALPSQAVFVDPRMELYPLAQWKDLEALERGENIDAILARYQGEGFFCTKQREGRLVAALWRRPEFELRYEDADFAYFVRR
jgi:hypothetical protein